MKIKLIFKPDRVKLSLRHAVFAGLCFVVFSGCATLPSAPSLVVQEEYNLKDLCLEYEISCQLDHIGQVVTLKRHNIEARAIIGNNYAIVDHKRIMFNRPVRISRGVIFVPYDFKIKIVQPMFSAISPIAYRFRKVVIDPGHGGKDPGAIGFSGIKEKDVVLDIAKRLQKALKVKGMEATLTRDSDRFLELSERTYLAQAQGADLFVSIHANSETGNKAYGVEVFYPRPIERTSALQIYDPRHYQLFFQNFSMKRNDFYLERTLIDLMCLHKQHESYHLSQHLTQHLSQDTQTQNRGHKMAEFYVLKHILIPSVLVEVGFLSNRREEARLAQAHERQRIADSIAAALLRYAEDH